MGVALAVSLSGVVLLVVSLGIVNRLISLSFPAYFERLWPIFGSCVAMIAAVGSARWLFGQAFSPLWEVLFFSGLGGLVYLASLRILAPAVYHEARLLLGRS